MTEQSQLPLVGPPKRRGWREIVWFRPLTPSTHAALVVTRRGRLVSVLPAGGPRVLSDYLSWPYDFREVDTRERLLMLDQRLESFDSSYEFSVSLRLIYQVVQPDRVALELEDVSSELAYAVTQSLRLSGRSFGVEQDKAFEEHLQETFINSDALNQRARLLGLVLRRADITVTLDEPTRARAEALRFAMRERPLHFQVAIESLEPDRSFDVLVGGSYRLTRRFKSSLIAAWFTFRVQTRWKCQLSAPTLCCDALGRACHAEAARQRWWICKRALRSRRLRPLCGGPCRRRSRHRPILPQVRSCRWVICPHRAIRSRAYIRTGHRRNRCRVCVRCLRWAIPMIRKKPTRHGQI